MVLPGLSLIATRSTADNCRSLMSRRKFTSDSTTLPSAPKDGPISMSPVTSIIRNANLLPLPAGDLKDVPWPMGDRVPNKPLPEYVNARALKDAVDFTFDRAAHGSPFHITVSLLIVYKGDILFERYAPGFDATTRTRTWSVAKSIANLAEW